MLLSLFLFLSKHIQHISISWVYRNMYMYNPCLYTSRAFSALSHSHGFLTIKGMHEDPSAIYEKYPEFAQYCEVQQPSKKKRKKMAKAPRTEIALHGR